MSDAFLWLQQHTESVGRLIRDLNAVDTRAATWEAPVFCAETLGTDAPVEHWYLAEYFMTNWTAWQALLSRYLQYFGVSREDVPCRWLELERQGAALATGLREHSRLAEWIAGAWPAQCRDLAVELDVRELYREIVASHERLMWVTEFASTLEAWQDCLGAARVIDAQVRKAFEQSSSQTRRQVLWHLRQYRHATLDVSWLDERRWKTRPSAFEVALGASEANRAGLETLRRAPLADEVTTKVAKAVLRRVTQAISELGYEAFLSDVCADDMSGGPSTPLGASEIELVTPDRPPLGTGQANVVIGLAKGREQEGHAGGWPSILETVLSLLEANKAVPAVAVMVSDAWDASLFDDAFQERCQTCFDDGHYVVFLLVGSPGTQVQSVPLSFGVPVSPGR